MAYRRVKINLEQELQDFNKGIEKLYSNDLSKKDYMTLQTSVYNFCTRSSFENSLPKNQLYQDMASFLRRHLLAVYKKFDNLKEEPLLSLYVKLWKNYCSSSQNLDGVCSYLNKHWIRRERLNGRTHVLPAYYLALVFWKDYVLMDLQNRLTTAILGLIEQERHEKKMDNKLIRMISIVLISYIEVEIDRAAPNSSECNLQFYIAFEKDFLDEMKKFYEKETASIVSKISVSEFMKKIENWFIEESSRCQSYLHKTTLGKLERILDDNVINKYAKYLYAEFKILLDCYKLDDLKRMFMLLSRIQGGLEELKTQFEKFMVTKGLLEIEKYHLSDVNDPKAYINTIIKFLVRVSFLVFKAFEDKEDFNIILHKAAVKLINENAVTKNFGSSSKSAELLAEYCDLLLKKKPIHPQENEIVHDLNLAIHVFKYIKDKDTFLSFYSKFLSKRLVLQTDISGNKDKEIMMISKLGEKYACAYNLHIMFQDVLLSQELTEEFKIKAFEDAFFEKFTNVVFPGVFVSQKVMEQLKKDVRVQQCENLKFTFDIDFSIKVLRTFVWPLKNSAAFSLPIELEPYVRLFTHFYSSRFSKRKLTWLYGISRGELVSKCFDKPYIFRASTIQMAVLLQFNTRCMLPFNQLAESTQIKPEILIQILQTLTKRKLLKDANGNPVTASSSIRLNEAYKNKKLTININAPIKSETRSEQETVRKHVKENRKFIIQATIVRIAKDLKVLKHGILLSEVIKQLSPQFKPEITVIESCIEILIEKEYLARTTPDEYCYVA